MPSKRKIYKKGDEPNLHRVHIAMEYDLYFGKWTDEKKKLSDKLGRKISNGQYAEYLLMRDIKKQQKTELQNKKPSCL